MSALIASTAVKTLAEIERDGFSSEKEESDWYSSKLSDEELLVYKHDIAERSSTIRDLAQIAADEGLKLDLEIYQREVDGANSSLMLKANFRLLYSILGYVIAKMEADMGSARLDRLLGRFDD